MKKIMSVAVVTALSMGLVACGGKQEQQEQQAKPAVKMQASASVIPDTDDTIGLAFSNKDSELASAYEACLPSLDKSQIYDLSKSYDFKPVEGQKVYHIATDAAYPPFSGSTADGKYTGYDFNVLMGLKSCVESKVGPFSLVVDKTSSFDDVINGLTDGKYNIGASGITIKEERKSKMKFGGSYITNKMVIVSYKGYKTLDDAIKAGETITFQTGTTAQFYLEDLEKKNPNIKKAAIKDNLAVINGFKAKTNPVVLTDQPVGEMMVAEANK